MKKINNLIYTLEINYINNSGLNYSISIAFHDNGLKIKKINVGKFCITEETINGRVLSGRLDSLDGYCGYRYDYQNGENLININPTVSINDAVSLINKSKMDSAIFVSELILSSILRNDYRVVTVSNGNLNITKTVSAENENSEYCCLQEIISLLKLDGEAMFVEQNKKRIYEVNDSCVVEENQTIADSDIKSQLSELSDIIDLNPQNYKDLIEFKNQVQKKIDSDSVNQEKIL